MSDIVDTLELMAHNYVYAARKLALLDASSEIQSLRMQNKTLNKRAEEAERRVRWLEGLFRCGHSFADLHYDTTCCVYCQSLEGCEHKNNCSHFELDGTPKPTPENFE